MRECETTCLHVAQGDENNCFVCSHYNLPPYKTFKLQGSFNLGMWTISKLRWDSNECFLITVDCFNCEINKFKCVRKCIFLIISMPN